MIAVGNLKGLKTKKMSNGNEIDDAWLSNIDASIHGSDFEFGGNETSSSSTDDKANSNDEEEGSIHTDHDDDSEDNEEDDGDDSQKDSDNGDLQGPVNEGGGKQEADKMGKREEPPVRCQFCNKRASIKVVRKSNNEEFNFCCVCFAKDFGTDRALEDFGDYKEEMDTRPKKAQD
jgi:hypothetical protein